MHSLPWTRVLRDSGTRSLLDLACGSGGFAAFLLPHLPECRKVVGIDGNEAALQQAREADWPCETEWRAGDAAALPFEEGSFDLVAIRNSLHHMADAAAVLAGALRVLRPGGLLLAQEMVSDGLEPSRQSHREMHHWWSAVDRLRGVCHHPTYSRQALRALLDGAGGECLYSVFHEPAGADPRGEKVHAFLEERITKTLQDLPEGEEWRALAEQVPALRRHLAEHGFRSATYLLQITRKA